MRGSFAPSPLLCGQPTLERTTVASRSLEESETLGADIGDGLLKRDSHLNDPLVDVGVPDILHPADRCKHHLCPFPKVELGSAGVLSLLGVCSPADVARLVVPERIGIPVEGVEFRGTLAYTLQEGCEGVLPRLMEFNPECAVALERFVPGVVTARFNPLPDAVHLVCR